MKRLFNKLNIAIATMLMLFGFVAAPVYAQDAQESVCQGIGLTSGSNGCEQPPDSKSVNDVIRTVVNVLSIVVGVAAVIMIIIGGAKYITSSGDSNNINSAKNTILYAIIGLVIVAVSQLIVIFVLDSVS